MPAAKRLIGVETSHKPEKPSQGAYGPRLREAGNIIKFRGNDWLKTHIEAEAKRYNMTVSNYLQAAMTTFLREDYPVKLYPSK